MALCFNLTAVQYAITAATRASAAFAVASALTCLTDIAEAQNRP